LLTFCSEELDLNIREGADPSRVRARDPEGEASDDDEYDHLSDSDDEDEEEEEEEEEEDGEYEEDGVVFSADGALLVTFGGPLSAQFCPLSSKVFDSCSDIC